MSYQQMCRYFAASCANISLRMGIETTCCQRANFWTTLGYHARLLKRSCCLAAKTKTRPTTLSNLKRVGSRQKHCVSNGNSHIQQVLMHAHGKLYKMSSTLQLGTTGPIRFTLSGRRLLFPPDLSSLHARILRKVFQA